MDLTCAGPLAAIYLAHVGPPASTFARAYWTRIGVNLAHDDVNLTRECINLAPAPAYFTSVALKRFGAGCCSSHYRLW